MNMSLQAGQPLEHTWQCEECGQTYTATEIARMVRLKGKPREQKRVCAGCYGQLVREQRIEMEAK